MANIGDKYIVEVKAPTGLKGNIFVLKNSVNDYIMMTDNELQGFEKYEPEADYQRGLNDAWEAARKIAGSIFHGGLNTHELMELFGTSFVTEIMDMVTADQAIEKLRTYEVQEKAEEEIKVGDEVETDYTGNVIIAGKPKDGWYVTIAKDFARYSIHESHIIKKTGRHFPQVAELLDVMEEGE